VAFGKDVCGIDLKKDGYQVVSRLHESDMRVYAVTLLCGLHGVSTQAYYTHEDTQMRKLAEEEFDGGIPYAKKRHSLGCGMTNIREEILIIFLSRVCAYHLHTTNTQWLPTTLATWLRLLVNHTPANALCGRCYRHEAYR
jgi:hypothetical protein